MIDLSCFGSNYIGIRGTCDDEAPVSGLYINDLPGVSLKLAAKLADEETVRGEELLRRIEKRAILSVWSDLQALISNQYLINQVLDSNQVGEFSQINPPEFLDPIAAEVGIVIDFGNCDPLLGYCVNYIDLWANNDAEGVLTISDGCNVKEVPFTASAACPIRVYLNYETQSDRVTITTDATGLNLADATFSSGCSCHEVAACYCGFRPYYSGPKMSGVTVRGWDGTEPTLRSFGMLPNVSTVCKAEGILCDLAKIIGEAVVLKMGVLLMQEILTSKRCNFLVSNSQDDARQMLLIWQGGTSLEDGITIAGEYGIIIKNLSRTVENYLKNKSSVCIPCRSIKVVESIP